MAVVGIITCAILELEFAHVLAMDTDLTRVTVLEDGRSLGLIEALASRGCRNLRRIPHISSFQPEPSVSLEVLVRVLEIALHRNRKRLQQALEMAVREMAGHIDALLLGYGLCGNALENVGELLDIDKPIFVPMDNGHPVDDCVGLLIGGRERYVAEQRRVPGTVFMIPGFASHVHEIVREDPRDMEHRGLKRMFARYERALLVLTPAMQEEEMRRNADEFIILLGLRSETYQGTLTLLSTAWQAVRDYLKTVTAEKMRPLID
jgi:hypothetical protein